MKAINQAQPRLFTREMVSVIGVVSLAMMAMSVLQPVLPLYLDSIGVSPATLGLMYSVAMAGMVPGESSAGWLADKIGTKIPLAVGTIGCIPLILLFAFTANIPSIFIIFLLWGVVRSAVFGPGRGYIGYSAPATRKATIMAIYAASMSLCGSLGAFIGGLVSDRVSYTGSFYLAAGVEFLGGAALLFGLSRIPWGKPLPAAALPAGAATPVKAPYRSRSFILQCVIAFLAWGSIGMLGPFLPLRVVDVTGVSATEVGVLFTAGSLVNAALLVPMGRITDRGKHRAMMISGLLVTAAGMGGIVAAQTYPIFIAAVIVENIGRAIFSPAAVALLSDTVPANWQNTAMGLYGGCEDIGVLAGSALGGLIWSTLGPPAAFLLTGVVLNILGAGATLALPRKRSGGT